MKKIKILVLYCLLFISLIACEKAYKDVTIIPENITEQVVIIYSTDRDRIEESSIEGESGLFNQLKVILRPKTSE